MPAAASVAFQGERGAFSEMAALQYFSKKGARLVPCKSFADVFSAAEKKKVDFAVIPVENSIEGSVPEVYDLLMQTRLKATGEVYHRVRHCLIANKGVRIKDVRRAYSHPQALGQCRQYLQKKKIEPVPAYDTAGSVKMVKEQGANDAAAIASRRAAELYGMEILEEGIEDRKSNYTRFLVLALSDSSKGARKTDDSQYKTSIIFSVKHVPGALFGILGEFAIRNLNLTKIESRPTKETPWEYNFYVDFEGHAGDRAVKQVLKATKSKTSYLKIIGSYRKAEF
ncbi:prephenate dehydratase [Nitrososphaera viennensis]|uniref:prephenate dehydratase n=2 Tax=Nitrososphaera viennensis TaxID=1034015 RepID=A0A060HN54_9ARCH|nr:prephenate dehydratase [Nitrososphaera viennensis]AIC16605.1 putative prephenate dehydratase [Nitrososphaera viennensis EN76]UVS68532.1 prephenate dehydratase [Nitrososphaera viennensis]